MSDVREYIKDSLRVFVVPVEILELEELSIYEKMVYITLRSYCNAHKPEAFPSYNTIAKMGSMSRRKAIDCVKTLTEKELIRKEARYVKSKGEIRHTSNLYTLDTPDNKTGGAQHAPGSAQHAPGSAQHAPKKNHLKEPYKKDGRMGDFKSPEENENEKSFINNERIQKDWALLKSFCVDREIDGAQTIDFYKTWQYQYREAPVSIVIATLRELLQDKHVYKRGKWVESDFKNVVGLFHHRMKTWREMAIAFDDVDNNGGWS